MDWEVLEIRDITDLGNGRTRLTCAAYITEGTASGVMPLRITINTAALEEVLARFAP